MSSVYISFWWWAGGSAAIWTDLLSLNQYFFFLLLLQSEPIWAVLKQLTLPWESVLSQYNSGLALLVMQLSCIHFELPSSSEYMYVDEIASAPRSPWSMSSNHFVVFYLKSTRGDPIILRLRSMHCTATTFWRSSRRSCIIAAPVKKPASEVSMINFFLKGRPARDLPN